MSRPRKQTTTQPKSKQKAKKQNSGAVKSTKVVNKVKKSIKVDSNATNKQHLNGTESSVSKHPVPLTSTQAKLIGPVVRINKTTTDGHKADGTHSSFKYSLINKFSSKHNHELKNKQANSSNQLVLQQAKASRNRAVLDRFFGSANESDIAGWKCSLCQREAYANYLGDLYGPYYLELQQPNGITTSQSQEVWVHEDCAVWSSMYMINDKLMNLEPTIEESAHSQCVQCKLPGATVGCFNRNCYYRALHYPCATEVSFNLDEKTLSAFCPEHTKH